VDADVDREKAKSQGVPLTGVFEAMQANLDRYSGLVHSQRVLLALTQAGMGREDAYQAVQRNAMRAWQEGVDFLGLLKADAEVSARLAPEALEACFDLAYHTKRIDQIFDRVFGSS